MTTDLQLDLLAIANNPQPWAAMQRERIIEAIRDDARAHGGEVHPNRVRIRLSNRIGLQVNPRMLSAAYSALSAQKRIAFDHWGTNDDTAGGNAGKPQRVWRWTGEDL